MIKSTEEKLNVAGAELVMIKGGAGKPLLILHDELGYPGWMTWNESLAHERTLLIPLQPGYRQDCAKSTGYWTIATWRVLLAGCCAEMKLDPIDVIGFSAGGFIAAEMIAADPQIFSSMVLVAPMGLKPAQGEIFDIFRDHDAHAICAPPSPIPCNDARVRQTLRR